MSTKEETHSGSEMLFSYWDLYQSVTFPSFVEILVYSSFIFCCIYFFKRINVNDLLRNVGEGVHHVSQSAEIPVQEMRNPFHVELQSQSKSSFSDGLYLRVSLLQPCTLRSFWGVDIEEYYKQLHLPWQNLQRKVTDGSFLDDKKIIVADCKERLSGNLNLHLEVPSEVSQNDLGSPPRQKYPVVVIFSLTESDAQLHNIVMLFTVLHLKDDSINMESSILSQFLVTNKNHRMSLQPYYLSTDNSDQSNRAASYKDSQHRNLNTESSSHDEEHNDQFSYQTKDCCVCQDSPTTTVLLPCRHASACDSCVRKLDKCPICREIFTSYFKTGERMNRQNLYDDTQYIQSTSNNNPLSLHWWERLNDTLNNYFGFT